MENFEYTHNTTMNLGWFKDMKRFLKIKKQKTLQEIGRQLFGPGTN